MSQSAISRIWRAFGLERGRLDGFRAPVESSLVETARDVVGVYLSAEESAVVFGVASRAAPKRAGPSSRARAPSAPSESGAAAPRDAQPDRGSAFAEFLERVDDQVPGPLGIVVAVDNLSTSTAPRVRRWLARHPRFSVHSSPSHDAWLSRVERWCEGLPGGPLPLTGGRHGAVETETDPGKMTADGRAYVWVRAADQIVRNIASGARADTQLLYHG